MIRGFIINADDPKTRVSAVFDDNSSCNLDQLQKVNGGYASKN
jgi:hypothetical protein